MAEVVERTLGEFCVARDLSERQSERVRVPRQAVALEDQSAAIGDRVLRTELVAHGGLLSRNAVSRYRAFPEILPNTVYAPASADR